MTSFTLVTSLKVLFPTTVTLAGVRVSKYKFGGCGVHNSVHNIIKTHFYPEEPHMILYKFPLSLSSKDFIIKDIHWSRAEGPVPYHCMYPLTRMGALEN